MTLLVALLGGVLFASLAMTINEGLWSNSIALFTVMIAGLLGITAGVPLGTWGLAQLESDASYTWYFVFAGIWGVFSISLAVMRVTTDRISRTRMRFLPVIDKIGGPLVGLLTAVMFTSFAAFVFWRVPIAAGNWKMSDASETQVSIFQYAQAPFYNVAKRFVDSEDMDSPLIP